MITAIEIENFKGIGELQRIELKPITLLFGPNSSGKSTILHALHYAREVLVRRNLDAGETESGGRYVDLGGFKNLVHNRNWEQNSVRFHFDLDLSRADLLKVFPIDEFIVDLGDGTNIDASEVGSDVFSASIQFKVGYYEGDLVVEEFEIGLDDASLALFTQRPGEVRLNYVTVEHPVCAWPDDRKDLKEKSDGILDFLCRELRWISKSGYFPGYDDLGEPMSLEEFEAGTSVEGNEDRVAPALVQNRKILSHEDFDLDTFRSVKVWHESKEGAEYYVLVGRRQDGHQLEGCMAQFPKHAYWTKEKILDALKWVDGRGEPPITQYILLKDQIDALPDFEGELVPDFSELDAASRHAFKILSRLIIGPSRVLIKCLDDLLYVGPIRKTVPRNYQPRRFQHISDWADGSGAWDALLLRGKQFTEKVSLWLGGEDKLDTGYSLQFQNYHEVNSDNLENIDLDEFKSLLSRSGELKPKLVLIENKSNLPMAPQDIGEGISQIIPVITAILVSSAEEDPRLITIEQPELHLHPRLQAKLGDLLIEGGIKEKNLLLIETHSEHLILRILRRIREATDGELPDSLPTVTPDDIAIYYVDVSPDGSQFRQIRCDEDGELIDSWPDGFFEERAEELF